MAHEEIPKINDGEVAESKISLFPTDAETVRRRLCDSTGLGLECCDLSFHLQTRTHEALVSTIRERLAERRGRAKVSLTYSGDNGMGLIILRPSDVFYTHETGGYSCYPSEDEGVFVPIFPELDDQEGLLSAFFTGSKWDGWCDNGIDEETADYLDHVLSLSYQTKYLRVDRTRLGDSREAWIYVDVLEPTDEPGVAPISGFGNTKGVFIWTNSD